MFIGCLSSPTNTSEDHSSADSMAEGDQQASPQWESDSSASSEETPEHNEETVSEEFLSEYSNSAQNINLPKSTSSAEIANEFFTSCRNFSDVTNELKRRYKVNKNDVSEYIMRKSSTVIIDFPITRINSKGEQLVRPPFDVNGYRIERKVIILISNLSNDKIIEKDYGNEVYRMVDGIGGEITAVLGATTTSIPFTENTLVKAYVYLLYTPVQSNAFVLATVNSNPCRLRISAQQHIEKYINLTQ